ncbi:biotin carboxylase N-terminal domain-containing protein [Aquisalimonas lutea]|uniref:acetyl/propionyl/methylcrotonyl-CoA carboxylase subunit alpha n=1 Tax=Aquisalimonas lutea TaxID=1327750 RepID=UPI0025B2B711|nr:biotin carboxylase N-terminal domain-containing protein [Aquisalimonas lutea]MDN3519713.1 biotin carboxylase N-terminal domain-containing protein [Aquisalimonas lutea]
MLESVLIANRGEIACRIIRTCQRFGIRTVAVFAEADADARHVRMADESHCIGPSPAAESYLRADTIMDACLAHGAAGIHPGYGFLSENDQLAQRCAQNGVTWIGPSASCIQAMGSKIESKAIAEEAGVAGVPGYYGEDQSAERLQREAQRIGFPVLIKASAGGGGKGMRLVEDAAAFADALDFAKREAKAAFGDERVLLEKYIEHPRHLEVQIAGDHHGNVVHFFERDCSIQRNYQKVVEEAPAANLDDSVREKLLDRAVRLAEAIGYDSLGTVEFILDAGDTEPYFLEMNTRLQVEHPVTELVTGFDLVELQLQVASGEPLGLTQDAIRVNGSAIEARVNAEDPSADYRPNLGLIARYREPQLEGVRTDSGVGEQSEVTPYYDSMLAKVIAHGSSRAVATRRLTRAMEHLQILGVDTNQAFLRDILRHPSFSDGVLTTRFISEAFPEGWQPEPPDDRAAVAAAAAVALEGYRRQSGVGPWRRLAGFRVAAVPARAGRSRYEVRPTDGDPVAVDLVLENDVLTGRVDDRPTDLRIPLQRNAAGEIDWWVDGDRVYLIKQGRTMTFTVRSWVEAMASAARHETASASDVTSSIPGLVTDVHVEVGQTVSKGEPIVAMDAMKLVFELKAPQEGTVKTIHCASGDTVGAHALLVEIEPSFTEAS